MIVTGANRQISLDFCSPCHGRLQVLGADTIARIHCVAGTMSLSDSNQLLRARCQLRQITFLGLVVLLLVTTGSSQQAGSTSRKRLFVDGKLIPTNRVVIKDGVDYVDASFLAEALGASLQSAEGGVMIRSAAKTDDCEKGAAEG